jgi:hypothetical protein
MKALSHEDVRERHAGRDRFHADLTPARFPQRLLDDPQYLGASSAF